MRPLDPRVLPHLRPAVRPLAVVLAASLLGGLLAVAQAVALGTMLVAVVDDPAGSGWRAAAGWLLVVVVARALASYAVDSASATAAGRVSTVLRHRLLDAVTRMPPRLLSRRRTGELSLLATRGTAALEPYLTRYLPALVVAAVLPVATLAAIWWEDWLSGLIVLLTLPLVPLFAALIGMATRDRAERQWRDLAALAGHFLDVVRGLPTLVAHRRARAQSATIRAVTERYRRASLDTLRLAFASSAALELIATLSVALVAVCVGLRLAAGTLDFRTAMVVLLLAPEAYWPLRRLGAEFHAAAEGAASFAAVDEALAVARPATTGPALPVGPVELDGLELGYGGEPVVTGLTVRLHPGLTAVVGPSGCGKSTLLAALAGELEPSGGSIRVGGQPLSDLDAWRRRVAVAPQRPWLTAGTIAENVRVGRPGASDAEVLEALARVALGPTVAALAEGIDTPLGDDGAGLSAGQRARVALARVVIAARPVVLLDEPTAHLDPETEAVLLRTVRWLAERSTVVVVAHRAAVSAAADEVLELPARPARPSPTVLPPVPKAPAPPPATGRQAPEPDCPRPARFGSRTGIALGALSLGSGVALTATAAWLITRASEHPPVLVLMVAIVGVRTFGLARPVLRYAERLVSHDDALRELARLRAEVYDGLVPLVPGRLGIRRGDALASVVDDVEALVDHRLRVVQPLWTAGLVTVAASVLTALASPAAGLVVLGAGLVAALGAGLARIGAHHAEPAFVSARAELSTVVERVLHGARQLDLWQATGVALAEVDRIGAHLDRARRGSARAVGVGRALVLAGCGAGPVAAALVIGPGSTSAAVLALLLLVPLALTDALAPTVDAAALSVRTGAALARVERLGRVQPAVLETPDPEPMPAGRDLAVTGVSAGWGATTVLHDLVLDLRCGVRIGVSGPSGSGKSTLAALLLRFLDPTSGSVRLGGTDLRDLATDDVRGAVGLVDDDPYLFASTLAENVRLARPGADDSAVEAALRAAHLGPWLDGLPRGLATHLGEGAASVSGGERARIGVARALLADQPVLVLDEPTAHLDSATATALAEELLAASHGRSLLWITHTSAGLDEMDEVVRLGAVTEERSLAVG